MRQQGLDVCARVVWERVGYQFRVVWADGLDASVATLPIIFPTRACASGCQWHQCGIAYHVTLHHATLTPVWLRGRCVTRVLFELHLIMIHNNVILLGALACMLNSVLLVFCIFQNTVMKICVVCV